MSAEEEPPQHTWTVNGPAAATAAATAASAVCLPAEIAQPLTSCPALLLSRAPVHFDEISPLREIIEEVKVAILNIFFSKIINRQYIVSVKLRPVKYYIASKHPIQ